MSKSIDYDKLSFVISSRYREIVAKWLNKGPMTPSEIDEKQGEDTIAHISRALKSMREEGLVELMVSEDRKKGRIYGLTEEGQEIADEVESRE